VSKQTSFKSIAPISTILSTLLALAAFATLTVAVDLNFELMSDESALISLGTGAIGIKPRELLRARAESLRPSPNPGTGVSGPMRPSAIPA
jgi:hypothetical protein